MYLILRYNLVRWAGATRWMVLRVCSNGCSVDILMTSRGISMYFLGLLFRVWEYAVMMCCRNVICRRFCLIL